MPRMWEQWKRTLLFVYPQHHNDFVSTNADELLYASYSTPREFAEEDHAIDVVVFQ